MVPIRQCPASVSCASCVLPSRPSPCGGLSPPPSTMRDKTPHPHAAGLRLHLPAGQEVMGLPKFFDASLPACHGLRTPADLPRLAIPGGRVVPAGAFKPSASATSLFDAVPALPGTRCPLRPPGFALYASPILFIVCPPPTPPWTQDALRVGGYPLPDRDFHPARDAKLFLARERPS